MFFCGFFFSGELPRWSGFCFLEGISSSSPLSPGGETNPMHMKASLEVRMSLCNNSANTTDDVCFQNSPVPCLSLSLSCPSSLHLCDIGSTSTSQIKAVGRLRLESTGVNATSFMGWAASQASSMRVCVSAPIRYRYCHHRLFYDNNDDDGGKYLFSSHPSTPLFHRFYEKKT